MDKITFELDDMIDIKGTSKKGSVTTTFANLVRVFGPPTDRMLDKTYNQWRIQFRVPDEDDPSDFDYVTSVIYDWMEPEDPARNPGKEITFNIGGTDLDAAYYVHQVLNK